MSNWVIETLIATTILMAAVLALRAVVAEKFGPRVAYLLWLAPALRMALPPLPPSWFGAVDAPVQSVVVVLEGASSLSFQPTTAVGSGIPWGEIALAVWLGGAALFFLWHMFRYLRFSRQVMASAQPLIDHDKIRIAVSAAVTSPVAFGIFGKAVLVPTDFVHRFSCVEQRLAIAHEVTHHLRRDLPVNLAALGILALHWFNPVAHFAHRAFRLDQEAACDAIVLDGATPDERHAYGSALFKSATGAVPYAVCAMGTTTQLKSRLRQIVAMRGGASWRGGTILAALLVVTGVVATASASVAAEVLSAAEVPAEPVTIVASVPAESERAIQAAEAAAEAANDAAEAASQKADIASAKASDDVDHARADVERAQADVARAQADVARAQADFARAQTEQLRTRGGFAVSAPAAPAPPAPPAPPTAANEGKANCPKDSQRQIITTNRSDDKDPVHSVTIVICQKRISVNVLESLTAVRAKIVARLDDGEDEQALYLSHALDSLIDNFPASPRVWIRLIDP
jgi:bla regulator protein blaR1